ncbi:MAG: hypothetical protein VKJ46_13840 [Leptolyngbyaceae bacterium]|nr:hypothetical protein [Leptolyngbyaceae bacterium]
MARLSSLHYLLATVTHLPVLLLLLSSRAVAEELPNLEPVLGNPLTDLSPTTRAAQPESSTPTAPAPTKVPSEASTPPTSPTATASQPPSTLPISPATPPSQAPLAPEVANLGSSQLTQPSATTPASQSANSGATPSTPTTGKVSADPKLAPSQPKLAILAPIQGSVINRSATTVVLQAPLGSKVELKVNGYTIDPSSIGRVEENSATGVVVQTWYGVTLQAGENTLTAKLETGESTSIVVQTPGADAQLRIRSLEGRIAADGQAIATILGELLDDQGLRTNRSGMITLTATDGEFTGVDENKDMPGFQVRAENGQFTARLRSSIRSGNVTIEAVNGKQRASTQIQFATALRPSLVSGVVNLRLGAPATDYYRSFRDFLSPTGNYTTDASFQTAVFATGGIGEWLFTGAYNSERPLNQDCGGTRRLYRDTQNCQNNYPVYGDSSRSSFTTPSQDSVYLRLERTSPVPNAGTDYGMWGDFGTEEFATRSQSFTSISRQLHGFKTNFTFGNVQFSGFYGDNVQGFQRDTIVPDGTSGFYFLSRRLLVPGSEIIFLETEELARPGTVISRTQVNRSQDYDIDYDRGTLLFRQPLRQTTLGKFGEVLVQRIVATYQFEEPGQGNEIYGGRLRYHFSREFGLERWLGVTYQKENQGIRSFELYGADTLFSFSPKTQLIAEYAHSQHTSELSQLVNGTAYNLEFNTELNPNLRGRAYYRSTSSGFANNATLSFVPGQTRYGAQVTSQAGPDTQLKLQYDHEINQGVAPRPLSLLSDLLTPRTQAVAGGQVDNSLTTLTAGVQQKLGRATLDVDLLMRERQDRMPPNILTSSSTQLRSRLSMPLADNLLFQAQDQRTLSSTQDAVFSDSTNVGVDWIIYPGLNLRFGQNFYHSGPLAGKNLTLLELAGEHKLGTDTSITSRYSIIGGANGTLTQGAIGLNQRWAISPGLRLNLGYERVFGDFSQTTAAGVQFSQPFAQGQAASGLSVQSGDSYSVGLEYTDSPDLRASLRYEFRNFSGNTNTVISAAATGKVTPSLTLLANYQQANSANQTISGLGATSNLKLGLAYRDPQNDNFNALLRYEYRLNPATIPISILSGRGSGSEDHTFAGEAIYAPNWQWEFYGKYALRNSTSYIANDLVGTSTISLAQLRTTYRLGYHMDLVGEARWIGQPVAGYSEMGFVLEAGYYLTPNLRLSAGYSSGSINNDRDFSGTRSSGGLYAGLTFKLNELFEGFGLQRSLPAPALPPQLASKPGTQSLQASVPMRLNIAQKIEFEAGSDKLTPKSITVLNSLAVVLKEFPGFTVDLQGYIASLSDLGTSQDIEVKRLQTARSYLIGKGIGGNQLIMRSLGQRPIADASRSADVNKALSFVLSADGAVFKQLASRLQNTPDNQTAHSALQSLLATNAQTTGSQDLALELPLELPTLQAAVPNLPQQAVSRISWPANVAPNVEFNVSNQISGTSEAALNQIVAMLQKNPTTAIELSGGASSPEASMSRMMEVRSYLIDKGIDSDRILLGDITTASASGGGDRNVYLSLSTLEEVPIANTAKLSPQAAKPTITPQAAQPILSPQAAQPAIGPQAALPSPVLSLSDQILPPDIAFNFLRDRSTFSGLVPFDISLLLPTGSADQLLTQALSSEDALLLTLGTTEQAEFLLSTAETRLSNSFLISESVRESAIESANLEVAPQAFLPTGLRTLSDQVLLPDLAFNLLEDQPLFSGNLPINLSLLLPEASPSQLLSRVFSADEPLLLTFQPPASDTPLLLGLADTGVNNRFLLSRAFTEAAPFTLSLLLPEASPSQLLSRVFSADEPLLLTFQPASNTPFLLGLANTGNNSFLLSRAFTEGATTGIVEPETVLPANLQATSPLDPDTRRLISALNFLLSTETNTLNALLRSLGVDQPDLKGQLIDQNTFSKGSE